MTSETLTGKPDAENPRGRFEGEAASATPRCWALLCHATARVRAFLGGAVAVGLALACLAGGDPLDKTLLFALDTRAGDADGDGLVGTTEVGDLLHFSSANPPGVTILDGYAVKVEGLPSVSWKTLPIVTPAFQTNNDPVRNEACIWFPQHYQAGAATNMSPSALEFDAPAGGGAAGEATMYVRFYWDGVKEPFKNLETRGSMVMYKWDWTTASGWTFCIHPYPSSNGKCYLSFGPGKQNKVPNFGAVFCSNTWYDVVATLAPEPTDDTKTRVNIWVARPQTKDNKPTGFGEVIYRTMVADQKLQYDDSVNKKIRLGAEYVGSAGKWDDASNQGNACNKCFRGGIRDLKIWDRALSEVEVYAALTGFYGSKWAVGASNGSADEFAAEDDAPAEVYDPTVQPWSRMRRALTAEHPALTLRSVFAPMETESASPRILALTPLFGDDMNGAPALVDIAVNGTSAGIFDLRTAEGRHAFIPGSLWTRDAEGKITVTVTRQAPVTGTLAIDALNLGSFWQVGLRDGNCADMTNENMPPRLYYGGDTNAFHFRRAVLGGFTGNGASNTYFNVNVPADVARSHPFVFSTRIISQGGSDATVKALIAEGKLPFSILLNGTEILASSGVLDKTDLAVSLKPGQLQAGLNRFEIKNRAVNGNGFTNWCWMCIDLVRLEPRKRMKGIVVYFR